MTKISFKRSWYVNTIPNLYFANLVYFLRYLILNFGTTPILYAIDVFFVVVLGDQFSVGILNFFDRLMTKMQVYNVIINSLICYFAIKSLSIPNEIVKNDYRTNISSMQMYCGTNIAIANNSSSAKNMIDLFCFQQSYN